MTLQTSFNSDMASITGRQKTTTITEAYPLNITVSRVNLGPLTTTFTPPSSCASFMALDQALSSAWFPQGKIIEANMAQSCDRWKNFGDDPLCWPPPSPTPTGSAALPLHGYGLYSPGLICPLGYTRACYQAAGTSPGQLTELVSYNFQYPLEEEEYAIGCCPE